MWSAIECFVSLPGVSGARVGRQQCVCGQRCQPHQTQRPEEQSNTDLQREQGERGQEQPGTRTHLFNLWGNVGHFPAVRLHDTVGTPGHGWVRTCVSLGAGVHRSVSKVDSSTSSWPDKSYTGYMSQESQGQGGRKLLTESPHTQEVERKKILG